MVLRDKSQVVRIDREDAVKRAVTHVVKKYGAVIQRHELERVAGAPRETIDGFFMEIYGLTPMDWVWMFRTAMAAEVLSQASQFTLEEVAHASGFHEMAHFARCFANLIGMAPNEFKDQASALIQLESTGRRKVFRLQALEAVQGGAIGSALEKMLTSLKARHSHEIAESV